jgi:hypothetical protein
MVIFAFQCGRVYEAGMWVSTWPKLVYSYDQKVRQVWSTLQLVGI